MRGGGTSQAGQAIGSGLIVDTSKYFNRVLEVNAAERWARVEPGIVLDELNAALRQHGLRFAPDISTASRATVGGMMANNSTGARSVIYGKTIDHVLEQQVVLSDGSLAHFRPLDARRARRRCAPGDTLEGALLSRGPRDWRAHAPTKIERRYPKILRRVGGYNLDAFAAREPAVQPGEADGRLRRHARRRPRGQDRAGAAAEGQGGAGDSVRRSARRARGDAGDPRARPVGRRGDGPVHPRSHEAEPGARTAAADVHRRRSGGAALRGVLRRPRRGSAAAASTRSSAICVARRLRRIATIARWTRRRRARSGRCARPRSASRWR